MSNRASLFNTEILSSDPAALERARIVDGASYVQIGEAANRIPVPWLACFRTDDLRPVEYRYRTGPEKFELVQLQLPCATVASARENLSASLPLYEAIIEDPTVANAYWRYALKGLENLPFANITIDPVEVLGLNDLMEEAKVLERCLTGKTSEVALLKRLAFFEDDFSLYEFDRFFNEPPDELDHQARVGNSAAFDPGYSNPEYRIWHRPQEFNRSARAPRFNKPWWRFW